MSTILVSGASGVVGYGILRSLRLAALDARLIGTTIYEDSAALAFSDTFEKAILTTDPGYISWLLDVIKRHEVQLLFPGIEADMYKWHESRELITKQGAKLVMNTPELITICRDKWTFYEALVKTESPCAIPTSLSEDFNYLSEQFRLPFILKPRKGFGSKGIIRVTSKEIFEANKAAIGLVLMAQPIVGTDDEEYTTSAFCNGQGGFYCSMTLRRRLSGEGFTEKAEVVDLPEVNKAVENLCNHFKPIGPTNFQFRRDKGELKLLEINPRISSSTSIRSRFGYNESKMAVDYYLNNVIPVQPEIRKGKAVRYVEDLIFYS